MRRLSRSLSEVESLAVEGVAMRAYVLINARPGKVRDLAAAIAKLEGVRHVDACWGVPDIFVEAQSADAKGLDELVIDQIQKLDGVERTETHIMVG